jgi:hypothetical protein
MFSIAAGIGRFNRDQRTYFQDGSCTWLPSWCWLLARGLFLSMCNSPAAAWVSAWPGDWLFAEQVVHERESQVQLAIFRLSLRSHITSFLPYFKNQVTKSTFKRRGNLELTLWRKKGECQRICNIFWSHHIWVVARGTCTNKALHHW